MEREKVTEVLSEEDQAVAKSIDTFEKLSGASVYAEFLRELNEIKVFTKEELRILSALRDPIKGPMLREIMNK